MGSREMESREFLELLKRDVMGHPSLVHPFLERFSGGDADEEGIRAFAVQYYRHVRVSRLYLAALISNCKDDEPLQLSLATVLLDEYGGLKPEETHPALYRRFMAALGLSEEQWSEPGTLPEIEAYIAVHEAMTGHPDVRLGLGAMGPASEWPVPPIYARLASGLRKAAGLDDRDLEIFISHVTMDVEHARIMMDATEPYVRDEAGQARVREGAMRSLDARGVMLDGLYRAVYREPAPLYSRPAVVS
ncbi:TenA family transcriptional regulator [Rubrobacter indicoceani]|uniref:TenA family transcriptional regulator n=1 Tax=Rubrobacter indicoceani TaxID=2051957 RepID=UPI0013C4F792|nr:iron-containing redox enzyme family protein [Rubrobacter indicoceani]